MIVAIATNIVEAVSEAIDIAFTAAVGNITTTAAAGTMGMDANTTTMAARADRASAFRSGSAAATITAETTRRSAIRAVTRMAIAPPTAYIGRAWSTSSPSIAR